jgi:hypothetical protein
MHVLCHAADVYVSIWSTDDCKFEAISHLDVSISRTGSRCSAFGTASVEPIRRVRRRYTRCSLTVRNGSNASADPQNRSLSRPAQCRSRTALASGDVCWGRGLEAACPRIRSQSSFCASSRRYVPACRSHHDAAAVRRAAGAPPARMLRRRVIERDLLATLNVAQREEQHVPAREPAIAIRRA